MPTNTPVTATTVQAVESTITTHDQTGSFGWLRNMYSQCSQAPA